MFRGSINWTSDISQLVNRPNVTVLVLGEYEVQLPPMIDHMTASILLPPCEATMLQLDGYLKEFEINYVQYLNSPELREYLSILFAGMLYGNHFVLYIGKDELELPFFNILLNYFASYYGVIIGNMSNIPFSHDFNNPNVINVLMEYNRISTDMYLSYYPLNTPIPEYIAYRLAAYYRMIPANTNVIYTYSEYFTQIRNMFSYGEKVTFNNPIQIVEG